MPVRILLSGTTIKTVSIPERNELPVTYYYCNTGRVLKELSTKRLSSFVRCMAKMCCFKEFYGYLTVLPYPKILMHVNVDSR